MDKKRRFARELILAKIRKDNSSFVTQRILDSLKIFHSQMFDGSFLSSIAEEVNEELCSKTES